ncbi:hypothetical protein KFK09_007186 [Dendrobium nobile]|uniref:CCHC-type domain-containing protein n=1 Tax=Dendrobium nobile TaxID=94219 RepID=A0A8T3BVN8_DENNO|nr:hypothetical protein KFK09_007186 [Dendrobium nobile]
MLVTDGYTPPTGKLNSITIPLPFIEWTLDDRDLAQLNGKCLNCFFCALKSEDYMRVSTCKTGEKKKEKMVALKAHKSDSDSSGSESDEVAFISRQFRNFLRKKQKHHWRKGKDNKYSKGSSDVVCYECRKPGHVKADCPILEDHSSKGKGEEKPKFMKDKKRLQKAFWVDSTSDSPEMEPEDETTKLCLMADDHLDQEEDTSHTLALFIIVHIGCGDPRWALTKDLVRVWYLDSGCSRHMTGDANQFVSLESMTGGKVTHGDNTTKKVVGAETTHIVFDESDPKKHGVKDDDDIGEITSGVKNLEKEVGHQNIEGVGDVTQGVENLDLEKRVGPSQILPRDWRYSTSHPKDLILGDPSNGVKTRHGLRKENILKKYEMDKSKPINTLMTSSVPLDKDPSECKVDRKSTSGTCQFIGQSLVSWSSRKQNSIALSTAEAMYIALGSCVAQILWLKQQGDDLADLMGFVLIGQDNFYIVLDDIVGNLQLMSSFEALLFKSFKSLILGRVGRGKFQQAIEVLCLLQEEAKGVRFSALPGVAKRVYPEKIFEEDPILCRHLEDLARLSLMATSKQINVPPTSANPRQPLPHNLAEADEEDENVKQLNECSNLYLALQECLNRSNRNWKSCQPALLFTVRAASTFSLIQPPGGGHQDLDSNGWLVLQFFSIGFD